MIKFFKEIVSEFANIRFPKKSIVLMNLKNIIEFLFMFFFLIFILDNFLAIMIKMFLREGIN